MSDSYVKNDREEHFLSASNGREEIFQFFSSSPGLPFSSLPKERHFSLISQSPASSLMPVKNMTIPSISNLMSDRLQWDEGGFATGGSAEKGGEDFVSPSERLLFSAFFRVISAPRHPASWMCLR
jgi:hypothetical protein